MKSRAFRGEPLRILGPHVKKLRMAVAQPYTRLGDIEGNLEQTVELSRTAAARVAD